MAKSFQDKVVLITGGASGIGYGAILETLNPMFTNSTQLTSVYS
jgi:NADP-dependent 3-hydroxy acid dehydrogenase YdfG